MSRLPGAVLFVCSLNRVRSPMAASLTRKLYGHAVEVDSCGLEPREEIDPMAAAVMQEIGVDVFDQRPKAFADCPIAGFDLVVALSAEAWPRVQTAAAAADHPMVEYWPVQDPTVEEGPREMRLEAYRQTRRDLEARITARFGLPPEWE